MRKMLVTGGAGFIGSNFVRHLRTHHVADEILVLDSLAYSGRLENLTGLDGVGFVHGNICDTQLVETLLLDKSIDTIVHFAAESHVDRSITGPDAFVETNIVGTHSLLKAARNVWLNGGTGLPHRFHHVSTDEVYGTLGPDDPAFSEKTPYAPNSPYAASKAASDHLVRAYNRTYGLNISISNCSNNYGPFQFPEKLLPLLITNALQGKGLPIYGDGLNVRDWLYVEDHCRAIDLILAAPDGNLVYNVGGGCELSNLEIIGVLCSVIDSAFTTDETLGARFPQCPAAKGQPTASLKTFVADRPGHDRRYAINCEKIERELGYRATLTDCADGLSRTLKWYLDNEAWWRSLIAH